MKLRNLVRTAKRWYLGTPERALDEAYRAALIIRAIENEHFEGQPVSTENTAFCDRVVAYFQAEVKQSLKTINLRLAEFRATRDWVLERDDRRLSYDIALKERDAVVIEKLNFIDEVLSAYEPPPQSDKRSRSLVKVSPQTQTAVMPNPPEPQRPAAQKTSAQSTQSMVDRNTSAASKSGALPRSILNTANRVWQEITPRTSESEGEMVQKFRQARNRTTLSIKFLLLLIIVPLLTHQLTKTFIFSPLIEHKIFKPHSELVFVNQDFTNEALEELDYFEKDLRFKSLIGLVPEISEGEMTAKLRDKAVEISEKYRHQGTDAWSNICADLCSLAAFGGVIFVSRKEIQILKDFLDEIIYGLSDSAKAFLIILFTDMFVGFHSPHGWEVILEGVSRHFGLPESRDFNFLFIATFPVILDTVLKYWIFRYLNRISPSAVATYKTMNE
ncbi:MAG: proton extrusion protein PcxA [Cyanobacteria bacterium P01_G01_bin.54]